MFCIMNYFVLWSVIYHIEKTVLNFSPLEVNVITDI